MKTQDFLNILEDRQLVPKTIVDKLRAKLNQGDSRITSKSVLKYLVKKELITRRQAKDLLTTTLTVTDKAESSILGIVPLPEQPSEKHPPEPKPMIADEPAEPAAKAPKTKPAAPEPVVESAPLDDPLSAFSSDGESSAGGGMLNDPLLAESTGQDPLLDDAEGPAKTKGKRKGKRGKKRDRKRGKQNEWDSPLLLLGGGGLVALLLAGGLIYWLLTRENADHVLNEATTAFESQNYGQSIEAYERFAEGFQGHPEYGNAIVRLGMAKIWKATQNTKKFDKALEVAQAELDEIEEEESFAADTESKRELSSLLTEIAEGLSEQAENEEDSATIDQRIKQTEEALALTANTKYVPSSYRQDDRLSIVEETLTRVRKQQTRDTELAEAFTQIDNAVADGDPAQAFSTYKTLLSKYPGLRSNEPLSKKVLDIAAAEQALVRFEKSSQAATKEPRKQAVLGEVALARRTGGAAQGVSGQAIFSLDGGLYGVRAADGDLLWRRSIGQTIDSQPLIAGGQVYCWEPTTGDLICLETRSGKLLWRQPLADRLATPVLSGDQLLVAGHSGKLYVLSAKSGDLKGYVQFSQPLNTPPALNSRGDRLYLAGEHSNIYTLSNDDLSCLGVYYLGHAEDSVRVSPLSVLNKLLVAENTGTETSTLHVLSLNDQGAAASETASERLKGLVTTPLLLDGRRLAAVTTLGKATVYEIGAGDGKDAIVELAGRDADRGPQVARHGLMVDRHLWIAGSELLKLAVQPTGNSLPVRSIDRDYQGEIFDAPLQSIEGLVLHARREPGQAGVKVSAMNAEEGKSLWETTVATPNAGPAIATGDTLSVISASGDKYELTQEDFRRGVATTSAHPASLPKQPLTFNLLAEGGTLFGGSVGSKQLLLAGAENKPKLLTLAAPLASKPIAWQKGVIAPTQVGQVFLLNASDGRELATAFQPELSPGKDYQWLAPAATGGDTSLVALSDGVEKIYALKLESNPQPHLAAVAAADIGPSPLVTQLATVGERVFAGTKAGKLVSFLLPNLEPGGEVDLGGQIIWGPYPAGHGMLVMLDTKEIVFVRDDQASWRQPFTDDTPAGGPLVSEEGITLARRDGHLVTLSLADGTEVSAVETGRAIAAGPTAFGSRVVVTSADGAVMIVDQ
ncbi:outer membrane protein assembly factor BamB family protein [Adhaeretor mobilis]|uniref:Outer membrane biogenesis protein BamB n=1 Tax=Adhaeretor mobilis TaxID=1930276 RepID=A0A517MX95_9BACT|nr:PQQ-binding-like beta-propeller repeat protein [Adhaeretor mobilis]QDS99502.1 outer membrane biogenesis protein BamB [Adhaeretor mobilis]